MKLKVKASTEILNTSVPSGTLRIEKLSIGDTNKFIEVLKTIPYETGRTEWNNVVGELADMYNNPVALQEKSWSCEECEKTTLSNEDLKQCSHCNSTKVNDQNSLTKNINEKIDRAQSKRNTVETQVDQVLNQGDIFLSFVNNQLIGVYHVEHGKKSPVSLNEARKEKGLDPIPEEGVITKYGLHKTIEDFVGGKANYEALQPKDIKKLKTIK